MITGVAFQTKARTVDHLGREQIADTPTAISELWKNAFDAYARNVGLDIFDGPTPVAVIEDDGHGMNRDEFINRWLVVGTESKATSEHTPIEDRNGLYRRPRQGQKGIGRLSCANLGPILLLVSKRRNAPFVAALVDWRLFENPFLNLSDIQIPVVDFSEKEQLFDQLPDLIEGLARNLNDPGDEERSLRLNAAWSAYDGLYETEYAEGTSNKLGSPSSVLRASINSLNFEPRHVAQWPVWSGESEHGTALLVSGINYDLQVELETEIADSSARAARDRFFETLSSFVDPYVDPLNPDARAVDLDFAYAVRTWHGDVPELIVGSEKQFDRRLLDGLEHQIIGTIDKNGVFEGRVKAFGRWVEETCRIEPPRDLAIPTRADTEVGPFDMYIASMEFVSANTTLPKLEFQRYQELAERYSGFMIFRDGLRVLPYGRTDNDFFEIESRRSKNAGREFWNHRQMFGRLAIARGANPNLKDKAGREGLLDNRAAKTLKLIVANILTQSARRYFGSASSIRSEVLPQVKASNKAERAKTERNKLRQRQRKEFRSKLDAYVKELPILVREPGTRGTNVAVLVNPQKVHAPEIEAAAKLLPARKIFVRCYEGTGATVRAVGEMVDLFPYDLLLFATHCGDASGYRWTYEFKDSEGLDRRLIVDIAIGVGQTDDQEMLRVMQYIRFHSLDGVNWNDPVAKANLYVGTAIRDYVDRTKAEMLEPIHKENIGRVLGSAAMSMADNNYLPMPRALAAEGSPLIFNNACVSWHELAGRFMFSGARAYVGSLYPVSDMEAEAVAVAVLGKHFGKLLPHALWASQKDVYGPDADRRPYVISGV